MSIEWNRRTVGVNFSGTASIAVWSPLAGKIAIQLTEKNSRIDLQKGELGYWVKEGADIQPGDRYKIVVDDNEFPDPASLSQPDGVHGPSEAIDVTKFNWTDTDWNNIPLEQYILYELHTGTFSPESTFEGIEKKLDYLVDLGVNAIEIMPVAQFPGARNWGYDGVFPFAVQNTYGGAEGLQKLVNACHRKGLAVILDVVYNHLGPEGNYLGAVGPYFTEKYKTPWGGALNFDDAWCDGVREYFIQNALMWFRDFHIDALRMDAVHAIKDFSPVHILRAIKEAVDLLMQQIGRPHYLIIENDLNDTKYINPVHEGGFGMDAQWVDEFHHALRVTAGGERTGYYSDFEGIDHLAKAYCDAYVYDGQFSPHRSKNFGVRADNNGGKQFVVFSQNHDQIGNRMLGERTSTLAGFEMQKLLAGAVLVSPYLPMLFMGEEWSEPAPFLYFVSHTDEALAEAVRKGRKEEFAAFHAQGEAPDPVAEETFRHSMLQWDIREKQPHATMLGYYKKLIALRKQYKALSVLNRRNLHVEHNTEWKTIILHRWEGEQHIVCLMNFSARLQYIMPPSFTNEWHILLDSAAPEWGGPAAAPKKVSGANPGGSTLSLQPQSIIIYTNQYV
jgi:maltooligosyltrehalose trehalohydrolase